MELLAPAGNMQSLKAAVMEGANSIYLGASMFSARQYADNFNIDTLNEAVDFCHFFNVKVYLAMNTLIKDDEITFAIEYIKKAIDKKIDGIIIQDFGLYQIIKNLDSNIPIHASTQMTIHNINGAKALYNLGFQRVVLSRELSMNDIKNIKNQLDIELEVFAHGALCKSYSGQCLMSSYIGGRSGNRGLCAQPCRLPYKKVIIKDHVKKTFVETSDNIKKYYLSLKDNSLIEHLDELELIGVDSLKIEGRMKREKYVQIVVGLFRKYIDNKKKSISIDDKNKLLYSFNRNGFTDGYFMEKTSNMHSSVRPNNYGYFISKAIWYKNDSIIIDNNPDLTVGDVVVLEDEKTKKAISLAIKNISKKDKRFEMTFESKSDFPGNNEAIFNVYVVKNSKIENEKQKERKRYVDVKIEMKRDKKIKLELKEDEISIEMESDKICQIAKNSPLSFDDITEKFDKISDYNIKYRLFDIEMDNDLFFPLSSLNKLKRDLFNEYTKKVLSKWTGYKYKNNNVKLDFLQKRNKETILKDKYISVIVKNEKQYKKALTLEPKRMYVPYNIVKDMDFICENIVLKFPSIMKNIDEIIVDLNNLFKKGLKTISCSNIGNLYEIYKDGRFNIIAEPELNVTNSLSTEFMKSMGAKEVVLSRELSKEDMNNTVTSLDKIIDIYGSTKVMTMETCPVECNGDCENCNEFGLMDEKGYIFPLSYDLVSDTYSLYNSKILNGISFMDNLNVKEFRLNFVFEDENQMEMIYNYFDDCLKNGYIEASKKNQEAFDYLDGNITKGHFNKGV